VDCDLSDKGREEAKAGGKALKEAGFKFDLAYSSVLKRAIHTLWICLDELDQVSYSDWTRFVRAHWSTFYI